MPGSYAKKPLAAIGIAGWATGNAADSGVETGQRACSPRRRQGGAGNGSGVIPQSRLVDPIRLSDAFATQRGDT